MTQSTKEKNTITDNAAVPSTINSNANQQNNNVIENHVGAPIDITKEKLSTNSKSNTIKWPKSSDNNQKKHSGNWIWILFPIVSISFIVIILFITNFSNLFPFSDCKQVGYTINQSQSIMSLAPIALDRSKYSIGQIVHINSEFKNDDNSQLPETYIEINRTHFPSSVSACYQPFPPSDQDTFALIKLDKTRSNHTFIPNQAGLYVISTYNSSKHKEFKTIFEVINPVKSITFIMLIIAIGFFLALVLLSYTLAIKNKDLNEEKYSEIKKNESYSDKIEEIYRRKMYDYIEIAGSFRFIFISALVWSIIFALMFTEVEIGTHSPFGLVIRHNLNPAGGELDVNKNPLIDWGINIGGNWENNFSSGVVIPFYIFILGLVGGYLRYLHKAATKEKLFSSKPKEAENDKPIEKTSLDFQENTNGEISSIFLAPLLAAVVWFIFSEGRPDFNIYGMAAVSFSIGLVTTEIIQIIIKFMNKIVP